MRTKTLLLGVAALVASMAISKAQPVYSANVVGYVNVIVTNNGFTSLATPVDYDGTGLNDTVTNLFGTNLPNGSIVEVWNGAGFNNSTFSGKGATPPKWSNPNLNLPVGQGYYISNPSNYPVNITYVGTVLQGNLTNQVIGTTGLYSMLGYDVPISGGLQTVLGYQPSPGDVVEIWNQLLNGGVGGFNNYTFNSKTHVWSPGEPNIQVGQGFFLETTNTTATLNTNFVVQ
jgi:hypothetical protein